MIYRVPIYFACITLIISTFILPPATTHAQATARWVADPELMTTTTRPDGSTTQQVNRIGQIALINERVGWATTTEGLSRFDGRFWQPALRLPDGYQASSIALLNETQGWVAGSYRLPDNYDPPELRIWRFDTFRTGDLADERIISSDGSAEPIHGTISQIKAFPEQALAVGTRPSTDQPSWTRPLVLHYEQGRWRDISPSDWKYGTLTDLSMLSPSEGWAVGLLGYPGGLGNEQVRPVALHYRDGIWSEEPLPTTLSGTPFGMSQVVAVTSNEAWAVYLGFYGGCSASQLLHYRDGAWSTIEHPYAPTLVLGLIPGTSRGWAAAGSCTSRGRTTPTTHYHFDHGSLTAISTGQIAPHTYAILNEQIQWAAAGGAALHLTAAPLPTQPIATAPAGARFFAETGHSLAGEFRTYWESHGLELGDPGFTTRESLALFGYPISEPFNEINPDTGQIRLVQYFERARMELHPENQPPYRVLLGRLAASALLRRSGQTVEPPVPALPGAECRPFTASGHALCPPLRSFWERNGGMHVFGIPISVAREELSPTDGNIYQTQWFERERLEYHPELANTPYAVLLGLMGSEELQVRGYLP
ncbi:MAG: hypothetical protein Fur005_44520 [Roseiflexaceae bacterium]